MAVLTAVMVVLTVPPVPIETLIVWIDLIDDSAGLLREVMTPHVMS